MINAKISLKAKAFLRSKASRIVALELAKQEDIFNKIILVDNSKQEEKVIQQSLEDDFCQISIRHSKNKTGIRLS